MIVCQQTTNILRGSVAAERERHDPFKLPASMANASDRASPGLVSTSDEEDSSSAEGGRGTESPRKPSVDEKARHAMSGLSLAMASAGADNRSPAEPKKSASDLRDGHWDPHDDSHNVSNGGSRDDSLHFSHGVGQYQQGQEDAFVFPISSHAARAALHGPSPPYQDDIIEQGQSQGEVDGFESEQWILPSFFDLLPPASSLDALGTSPFATKRPSFGPSNSEGDSAWNDAVPNALERGPEDRASPAVASLRRNCDAGRVRLEMFKHVVQGQEGPSISDEDWLEEFKSFGASLGSLHTSE